MSDARASGNVGETQRLQAEVKRPKLKERRSAGALKRGISARAGRAHGKRRVFDRWLELPVKRAAVGLTAGILKKEGVRKNIKFLNKVITESTFLGSGAPRASIEVWNRTKFGG